MHSDGPPLSFHVYRVGGFLGDDRIVKAQDKITNVYYLKGSRDLMQWHLALHADRLDGPLICQVSSGYLGPPMICDVSLGPMLIRLVNVTTEKRPIYIERRRGTPEGTHWFRGLDDKEYCWQSSAYLWRNEMQCSDAEGKLVATYRITAMALSKDGELRIYPSGQFMTDLLVATSLALRTPSH